MGPYETSKYLVSQSAFFYRLSDEFTPKCCLSKKLFISHFQQKFCLIFGVKFSPKMCFRLVKQKKVFWKFSSMALIHHHLIHSSRLKGFNEKRTWLKFCFGPLQSGERAALVFSLLFVSTFNHRSFKNLFY